MILRLQPSARDKSLDLDPAHFSSLGRFPFFSPLKSTPSIQAVLNLPMSGGLSLPLGQKSLHPSSRVTFGLLGLWQLLQLNSQRGQRYFSLMVLPPPQLQLRYRLRDFSVLL